MKNCHWDALWKVYVIGLWLALWVFSAVPAARTAEPARSSEPMDFFPHRAGAEVNAALRIGVTNTGLCRVSAATLLAAGVPPDSLVGDQMRLFCRTQEAAIVTSSAGRWNERDYLLFYSQGYDGEYSATNVYWLGFGSGGRRMASRSAAPLAGMPWIVAYAKTVCYDRHYYYQDTYRPDDATIDHWFAEALRDNETVTVTVPTDYVTAGNAVFQILLYGKSSVEGIQPDHNTRVRLNAANSIDFLYDGQNACTGTVTFSASILQSTNRLELTQALLPGVTTDYALLKRFSMIYPRLLMAEGSVLIFAGSAGNNNYRTSGFPAGSDFFLLDVSDPANPVRLTDFLMSSSADGAVTVEYGDSRSDAGSYFVAHGAGIRDIQIAEVQNALFRNLASTARQADYLVICPYEFRAPVYRLLTLRRRQGLTVAVAPLGDIYNEFNYGIADAAAIKQFLGYAFRNWRSPAPRYVLLTGRGTYDPRHYVYPAPEIVPAHLGPTSYKWTALDGWYAQVNGDDDLPAMALGRIPVETADQLNGVVDKIMAFESVPAADPVRRQALLAADKYDAATSSDFKGASEFLRTQCLLPNGFQSMTVYLDDTVIYSPIMAAINNGVFLVNYSGHGALDQWSGENIFDTASVSALTNTRFPVFVMLTCQNGVFQSPVVKCLAESLLESSGHGAVACVASSGLTSFADSNYIGAGFYQKMINDRAARIGDAMLAGYAALLSVYPNAPELVVFGLFGDPAMVVNW